MSEATLKFSQKGPPLARNEAARASQPPGRGNVAEGFPFWQSRLVTVLGVSEDLIREARAELVEGVDWCHQGQRVLFSEKGLEGLKGVLRVMSSEEARRARTEEEGEGEADGPRGGLSQTGPHPTIEKMRVVRVCLNRHLVECVPADGEGMPRKGAERVRVKVRSNENFVPGMLLRAAAIAGTAGLFCLVGACPRWRGRF